MRSNEILLTNTNTCLNGQKCNCYNSGSDWREDSGLLTDKSTLPVTQIRLGDLDQSHEEGYHTLGKLKCYGQAWWTCFATNTARLSKGISFGPVVTFAQIISVKIRHACYMRRLSDDRLKHTETLMAFWIKFHRTFSNRNFLKSVTKTGDFFEHRLEGIRILLITFKNCNKLVLRVLNQVWNI